MAKYTMELRNVSMLFGEEEVVSWFKDYDIEDYLTDEQIEKIEEAGIWNKDKLASKIYRHYFMREIGFETPALFRHYVKITMEEIMQEYLPLIYSASLTYDPLVNEKYTETYTQTGSATSSSTNSGNGLTINSDTPQGQINKQQILNGSYATNTTGTEASNTISDQSSGSNSYSRSVEGNRGISATYQKLIEQYRDNIRAIDHEIIEKLNDLFMGIY